MFAALYWLMAKIALPRIAEIFEARRARIEGDLAAATAMQGKADDAATAYEKSLSEAKAKHMAEDAGLDPATVTGEQVEYRLVATSVSIRS